MLSQEEYTRHDGLGLAALVQRGEVAPVELLDAAIARIAAHNPALNAVVRTRYEQARAEAARVDRAAPFAGVPFLVKDLISTLAGGKHSVNPHVGLSGRGLQARRTARKFCLSG